MGYVLRVRLASFFTGAALASAAGLYYLQKDYQIAHHAIAQQVSFPFPFPPSSAFAFKFITSDSAVFWIMLSNEIGCWLSNSCPEYVCVIILLTN